MTRYLVICYWDLLDKIEFDILETDAETGTMEFEELIEMEYEHNQNIVLVKQFDERLLSALRELHKKLNIALNARCKEVKK